MKKLTTENFIEKAKKIHGDKYDYSLVDYKNSATKVKIICPIHGIFEQTPNKHLAKHGCPKCSKNNAKNKLKKTTEKFILESKLKYGDKYDYSLVDYKNQRTKVKIICPIHGIFEQTPNSHLMKEGCPKCNESYGEKEIRIILENNNISYEYQKRFEELKTCPFDFYLPKLNIVIEYQGKQHYKENHFFGDLKSQQERDERKRNICKQLGIKEIEIRYDQNILTALKENGIIS